jgi:hypothetical protein
MKGLDDFTFSLIRNPMFSRRVDHVEVECGDSPYQSVLDRFHGLLQHCLSLYLYVPFPLFRGFPALLNASLKTLRRAPRCKKASNWFSS